MQKYIEMLPHQARLIQTKSPVASIVGGVGSGKSHALAFCLMQWIQEESNHSPVLAGAPTHEQLDKSTMARIKEVLAMCDLDFVHGCKPPDTWDVPLVSEYRKFSNILTVETGHVVFGISMEEPSNIRGPQYGMAILDELAFCDNPESFEVVLGRLRCKYAKRHRLRAATSPNGRNWFYDYFIDPVKRRKGYEVIRATTLDNVYNPAEYIKFMEDYDDEKYRQEVLGEFIESGFGRVYTEFRQERHCVPCKYDPDREVYVGADFNRSPLCWVLCHYYDDQDQFQQFGELVIKKEATTHEACENLLSQFDVKQVTVFPDASCRSRNTSGLGTESDLEVIQSYGFDVVVLNCNPRVPERVEAVQERFRRGGYLIDPSCECTIHALNRTTYMPGSRMVRKTKKPGDIGEHPADAIGYLVYAWDKYSAISEIPWMS